MRLLHLKRRIIIADVRHGRNTVSPHLVHPFAHKRSLYIPSGPVTQRIYLVNETGHSGPLAEFPMQMRQLNMAMGIDKTGNQCAFGDLLHAITLPDPDNPAVTIIIFNEPVPYRCGFQGIYKRCRYPFYRHIP